LEPRSFAANPLYPLERSDVGVMQLDRGLHVMAMISFARRALPVEDKHPFEKMVLCDRANFTFPFIEGQSHGGLTEGCAVARGQQMLFDAFAHLGVKRMLMPHSSYLVWQQLKQSGVNT